MRARGCNTRICLCKCICILYVNMRVHKCANVHICMRAYIHIHAYMMHACIHEVCCELVCLHSFAYAGSISCSFRHLDGCFYFECSFICCLMKPTA